MDPTIKVIGVYPIDSETPVHLIEILVRNSKDKFDLSIFTQGIPSQPKEHWQVPWNEKLLDGNGNNVIADDFAFSQGRQLWIGDLRIVFFFHYLDISKPLITPFGSIDLPEEKPRPKRLSQIIYEAPD